MSGRMASCGMGAVALLAAAQALPAGAAPVASARFENLDRIDSLVAMTVGAGIGQTGGAVAPVDRRLRLQACPQLPEVTGPVFGAAMVQCKALGWRIRVPLRLETSAAATPGLAARARYDRPAAAAPKTILIRKGDPVQLVAGGASFTVSRMMVADEDGAVGDMIRVREDRKSAPVLAQVTENGIVRVPGFKEY